MIQMLNLLSAKISMVMGTLQDLDRKALAREPQTSDCSSMVSL